MKKLKQNLFSTTPNVLKKGTVATLCMVMVGLFLFTGCKSNETDEISTPKGGETQICEFKNPLTDLPWLKEIVDGFEDNGETHARIYQCTYSDGIGFLLEMCVGCPDAGYSFRDCEGTILCGGGGLSGEDNCSEFNIDFENKKLIWEINMNDSCEFENPLTDLPWLKACVDAFESDSLRNHVRIYQCTYINGMGFLLQSCVGCPDAGYELMSCEGKSLCVMYGLAGNHCEEFYVDFENKKLIWEIE